MNFEEAIVYIKSLDVYGSVLGLDNMKALAKELDNPEAGLKFIHVTGTNGKGSVCAYLSAILKKAGYKVGAYNSPAVISDTDQYTINGKQIPEGLFCEAVSLVKDACVRLKETQGIQPTRFEVETMVAFVAFYIDKCDIVVLETGLGGRDDATNIIENTILHVFTPISADHLGVIGDTIEEIAANKAGIIKPSAPVLMYEGSSAGGADGESDEDETTSQRVNPGDDTNLINNSNPDSEIEETENGENQPAAVQINENPADVILKRAQDMGCDVFCVSDNDVSDVHVQDNMLTFSVENLGLHNIESRMMGAYQPLNACIAANAARILSDIGFKISDDDVRKGIKKAKIPFRFEGLECDSVDIILDGAHNPAGAKVLTESLKLNYPDRDFIFITGIFKDKDYEEIAEITGGMARTVYAVENDLSARALPVNELTAVLLKHNSKVITSENIECAVEAALDEANACVTTGGLTRGGSAGSTHDSSMACNKKPVIVCFGSLSWLNRAKAHFKKIAGERKVDTDKIRQGVNLILEGIGEDVNREGLLDTPDRVVRMYEEIFAGLGKTAEEELSRTFTSDSKDMIVEKDITFYSMCEHHLMPFYGKAHIAYIPDGKVVGISKLARCVEVYARRPQIQENLTEEIADAIMKYLKPKGVMVMLEAEHMCMTMRGVKKPGTKTVTICARGKMKSKDNQSMFFELVGR